jgi:hypothetical protein
MWQIKVNVSHPAKPPVWVNHINVKSFLIDHLPVVLEIVVAVEIIPLKYI